MSDVSMASTGKRHAVFAYLELCKPRVVALMLLTALVGMLLATEGRVAWQIIVFGLLGIACCAASGAAINHLIDRRLDAAMLRTEKRPLPSGQVTPTNVIVFSTVLMALGVSLLVLYVNVLTAVLSFFALIGYAVIYTVFLKRATPQNIVIGGFAGAMPPLLGWVAVTGTVDPGALLLVLIIFAWTPPHFWALAIYRYDDYKRVNMPMLPVTHGIRYTKKCILLYTALLCAATLFPVAIGMSGGLYFLIALALNARFVMLVWRLWKTDQPRVAIQTFYYSIYYLGLLFLGLLLDHYVSLLF